MNFKGLYDIRPAVFEDQNFVLATFLRGLYYSSDYFKQVPKDIFMTSYKNICSLAWSSPAVSIKVACLKEDPQVILGYSVTSANGEALMWIYVKTAWRKQGIGKSLLPNNTKYVTNINALGSTLIKEKLPGVVFNPFY